MTMVEALSSEHQIAKFKFMMPSGFMDKELHCCWVPIYQVLCSTDIPVTTARAEFIRNR